MDPIDEVRRAARDPADARREVNALEASLIVAIAEAVTWGRER